jgi:predicted metal-dependent HD superfamily phosphohydrolase
MNYFSSKIDKISIMKQNDQTKLINDIAARLQKTIFSRLPEHLYYHHSEHTTDDVLPTSVHLASMESISADDLFLLQIAALFHDTGFIERYHNNEEIGVRIAGEVLPGFGFSTGQIQRIGNIILATRIAPVKERFFQMAGNDILEKIICDADLDNLGREDFFDKSANLYKEMGYFEHVPDEKEWVDYMVFILESHRYYTASAIKLRAEGQKNNLAKALKMRREQ